MNIRCSCLSHSSHALHSHALNSLASSSLALVSHALGSSALRALASRLRAELGLARPQRRSRPTRHHNSMFADSAGPDCCCVVVGSSIGNLLRFRPTSVYLRCTACVEDTHRMHRVLTADTQPQVRTADRVPAVCMHSCSVAAEVSWDAAWPLSGTLMQLREAEEQGLLVRSLVSASAAAGKLAIGQGSSCAILDLPGSRPAASGAASFAASGAASPAAHKALVPAPACSLCLAGQGQGSWRARPAHGPYCISVWSPSHATQLHHQGAGSSGSHASVTGLCRTPAALHAMRGSSAVEAGLPSLGHPLWAPCGCWCMAHHPPTCLLTWGRVSAFPAGLQEPCGGQAS